MKAFALVALLIIPTILYAQSTDELFVRKVYDVALIEGKSYSNLEYITTKIGPRLSGSANAAVAVQWTKSLMEQYGFDSVWLQPVMVPHWVRGKKEVGRILPSNKSKAIELNVCALGGSIATGAKGITAPIIEVKSFDELATLGSQGVRGKIIFFNRPMDPKHIDPSVAYFEAGDHRRQGAREASKYGAVAVIVRSLSLSNEDYPHTGNTTYDENGVKIPALSVSTKHANILSDYLKTDKGAKLYMEIHSQILPDAPSFNVVGEIKGTINKEEIIAVGGHLDSWDLGHGAHDDATGVIQSIEVLRIFRALGYKPKRTIRVVLFMNEENGLRGATKYGELAKENKEKHLVAIEADRGGYTPRGFTMAATDEVRRKVKSWRPVLEPYGLYDFDQDGGGIDFDPLQKQGATVMEFYPDQQRYYRYHHTVEDTFDKVDQRELESGAAAIAALVYLIDQHGL